MDVRSDNMPPAVLRGQAAVRSIDVACHHEIAGIIRPAKYVSKSSGHRYMTAPKPLVEISQSKRIFARWGLCVDRRITRDYA